MTDLTHAEIVELKRLEAAATPGPWLVNPFEAIVDPANALYEDGTPIAVCKILWPTEYRSEDETFANAELIAAARNALPGLLADRDAQATEIATLRRQLAEREAEVERLRTDNAQAWKMANKYREQGA